MYKIFKQSGLTILEVIVSLGIVMVGMLGVATLSQQNIVAQNINKSSLLSAVLAQEAVELIRNKRDTNQWNNWDWLTGDGSNDTDILQDGTYVIQYDGSIYDTDDIDDTETQLYITPAGYYVHESSGNTATSFRRLVTIVDNTDYIDVVVEVQWNERGRNHEYEINTRLYDWW